jgi:transposase
MGKKKRWYNGGIETHPIGIQVELKDIDVEATLKNAKELLEQEEGLSPAIKATMDILILVVHLFANRVGLNNRNSSKPPSTDPNRPKKPAEKFRQQARRTEGAQRRNSGKNQQTRRNVGYQC